jgi:hypothetical protein
VTSNRQEPFLYGSLGGEDVTLVPLRKPAALPSPAPDPLTEMRRDYELALQIGNKSAFTAFLAQYPSGYYASLAKLQLEKIAGLEAEAAQREAQAKAEARAAEQARLAAEKASQIAKERAAEADALAATAASAAPAAGPAITSPATPATNMASLDAGSPQADLTGALQSELRRVGCLTTSTDDAWNTAAQRSLKQFNRYAGTKFDTRTASNDALDAVKQRQTRVCPLSCEHGFKVDGDHCTKIVCAEGLFLNDDNQCEKRREKRPVATRGPETTRERPEAKQFVARRSQGPMTAPQTTGRALTGQEREEGCNSYQAIMSGRCP